MIGTCSNSSNIAFDSIYDYIYGPTGIPIEQINVTEPYFANTSSNSGANDNPNYMYYVYSGVNLPPIPEQICHRFRK